MRPRFRFGSFELDLQESRLTADGRTVKIQPQPLRVLGVLVQRAGDLVTRDELRAEIWDQATFVEFDQGLNYCIRQIRIALGDDAAKPIYLETVKGRGYRFVAAVTRVTAPAAAPAPAPPQSRRGRIVAVAAATAALLVTAGLLSARVRTTRWLAPAEMMAPVQVTDFADSALAPALSPDGRVVAFIRGNSSFLTPDDIYVKTLPDGEARRLVHDPRLKYSLAFSPDGSLLAYTVMDHEGWSTYAVPVTGGEPQRMLANAAGLSWIDNRRLLFAEVRGGQHMGFVTGPQTRAGMRDVYFPAHQRAMAHYASVSPDRRSALIVEMDGTGAWAPCRLVRLDGGESRQIGPRTGCLAAAWSPDGRWMYFNSASAGHAHLWRQPVDESAPEEMTRGPADELGIAMAPDGRSLITSAGVNESTLWLHSPRGDRQLSFEGQVEGTSDLSADGRVIYYVLRRAAAGDRRELHRRVLTTDQDEIVLPGIGLREFDIAPDGSRIVYSTATASGSTELWVAALGDRSAPRRIAAAARSPHFGPDGGVIALVSDGRANFLQRWRDDGTGWTKVVPYPINEIQAVSPARTWVMAITPLPDNRTVAPMAVPLGGGNPVRICESYCHMSWASDGSVLYVSVEEASAASPGRALAIAVGPHESLPAFPSIGLHPNAAATDVAGATSVPRAELIAGPDPATFAYVRIALHRNLFRIPLAE